MIIIVERNNVFCPSFKTELMKSFVTAFLLLCITHVQAQQPIEQSVKPYPQNYFRNPLRIPIFLAGNFGECRPNHFHSGIDIKTKGVENEPVYAAADGYVSRIKMDKGGFGHALYITHPNGFTTLYAHLNNFNPALQSYLRKQQYKQKKWAIDMPLSPNEFTINQGQQIAWSGNTGGSTAPHLHFEIRDTKTEHPLNPMLFGLPIIDNVPPLPVQLAFYNLHQSIYEQTPIVLSLKKQRDNYGIVGDTVALLSNKIGVAINVDDFMDGSTNTLNFFRAQWYIDEAAQGAITLDNIGYEETRYLHAYIDYKLKKEKGNWYQLMFELPGNKLHHIYKGLNNNRGAITLNDEKPHFLKIILTDANGNATTISCYIKSKTAGTATNCSIAFKPEQSNFYEHPNIRFQLKEDALYDEICFEYKATADEMLYSQRFNVHSALVPVHSYFNLFIKPDKPIPFLLRDKMIMVYKDEQHEDAQVATYDKDGWYKASVRKLGSYWLSVDTTAPTIKPLQKENANLAKARRISFEVKDDKTTVPSFTALLDGKWLCFEPRGNQFFYEFDNHCPKGRHTLNITAVDENGNEKKLNYTFTR